MGLGFPGGSAGKESTCNVQDLGWIPGLGRSAGEENGSSILAWRIPWTENSMDCIVQRVAKNQTWLSDFHFKNWLMEVNKEFWKGCFNPSLFSKIFPFLLPNFLPLHCLSYPILLLFPYLLNYFWVVKSSVLILPTHILKKMRAIFICIYILYFFYF